MEDILVTIVTVCLNSEKTIRKSIDSVFGQTYKNIEYIIIDGKSDDETLSIIHEYMGREDIKIKLISESDTGLYDAMNKGIRLSKGEIIGLLNSDDWYEPDAVESVVERFEHDQPMVLYGMIRNYRNGQEHSVQIIKSEFLEMSGMCHSSCFISKKAYNICGLYDLKYKIVSDYDLLLRMKNSEVVKFIPIYKILTDFTMGGISSGFNIGFELNEVRYRYRLISQKKFFIRLISLKMQKLCMLIFKV